MSVLKTLERFNDTLEKPVMLSTSLFLFTFIAGGGVIVLINTYPSFLYQTYKQTSFERYTKFEPFTIQNEPVSRLFDKDVRSLMDEFPTKRQSFVKRQSCESIVEERWKRINKASTFDQNKILEEKSEEEDDVRV